MGELPMLQSGVLASGDNCNGHVKERKIITSE